MPSISTSLARDMRSGLYSRQVGDGRDATLVGCGARRSMPTCRQPLVGTPSTLRYGNCQINIRSSSLYPTRSSRTMSSYLSVSPAPSLSHRRRSAFDPAPMQAMCRMPFPPVSPTKPPEMLESIPKHHQYHRPGDKNPSSRRSPIVHR